MASLLCCSYHCIVDPSSGAAQATRDLLALLAGRGWDCRVLCGPRVDFEMHHPLQQVLADDGLGCRQEVLQAGAAAASILHVSGLPFPVTLYAPADARMPPTQAVGQPLLLMLERALNENQPDILLTYGGHWIGRAIIAMAKRHGVRVVFALHNFSYERSDLFSHVDGILTPSQFTTDYYLQHLGINSTPIPSPLDWGRLQCQPADAGKTAEGRHVTFVNPQPDKGVFWFARIAEQLNRQRPDIALLVKEGRGSSQWLSRSGLTIQNLKVMGMVPDPRDFYRQSRVVLMPSLWYESFGRVAAEATLNGIPVLASRRGALAETLSTAGFLFDIPTHYTPQRLVLPTAQEVQPWVDTILRLYDDHDFYRVQRLRCLAAADAWRPEILGKRHEEFFFNVLGR